jgi:serine-type D-Ala-D-Ala carboxypeptidase (penicillin-binding protein 5/6)
MSEGTRASPAPPPGRPARTAPSATVLRSPSQTREPRSFVPSLQDRPWRYATPAVRRRAVRRRRRLVRTLLVCALAAGVVAWILSGPGAGSNASTRVAIRTTLPATAVVRAVTGSPALSSTGTAPPSAGPAPAALPWPPTGQAAVDIPTVGFRAQSAPEHAVPVASLTKIMTAYVVLEDHPLAAGSQGPKVRITVADADNFGTDTVTDQASIELKAGEVLTEYQLLEGLLVHSANDFAYALASWDAGSVPAFVAKMNATAARLGMQSSHFVDASGFDAGSVSTASDLLVVAAAAMADPTFAQIVTMPSVTMPVGGLQESYTPLIGTTGVVGVKSGYTNSAGGGDVLAYQTSVGGRTFVTLAAVTSQEGPTVLFTAGKEALAVARAAANRVEPDVVTAAGRTVARLVARTRRVDATTAAAATLLAVAGDTVRQHVQVHAPHLGAPEGTRIGTATFQLGTQVVSVPVRTSSRLS